MDKKCHYSGLTEEQVRESRAKYGTNVLTPPEKDPLWKQFLELSMLKSKYFDHYF